MIAITDSAIDARAVEAAVARDEAGAICCFQGITRVRNLGREVLWLEYEAYPEMAEAAMRAIAEQVAERWPEARAALVHRTGRLEIGEASVVIAVSSPHRAAAFDACRYAIDRLKETVPVWKKEVFAGGEAWIEGVAASPMDLGPFAGGAPEDRGRARD